MTLVNNANTTDHVVAQKTLRAALVPSRYGQGNAPETRISYV